MRLKSLTLALIISISSGSTSVLSMDDVYDADDEYESRKKRGASRYLHQKREKARLQSATESDSDNDLATLPARKVSSIVNYDADDESETKSRPKQKKLS
ncbi:MAG: hypothetical protein K2W94_05700 [Alphaproteobacteria bacterium]|nr:hypothetical protein [Alphaproteobacteria bacterium]